MMGSLTQALMAAALALAIQAAPEPESYEVYYEPTCYGTYYEDYYEPEYDDPAPPAEEAPAPMEGPEPGQAPDPEPAAAADEAPDLYEQGVVRDGGYSYTWYNHADAPDGFEGELGDDGIWRDSDGYIAVAYGMEGYGEVIETPWGEGKVYDHCPGGSVDVWTAWD